MFVQLWMSKEMVVAKEDTTIADADALLKKHKIRRLPVVDNDGQLLGIISKEDIDKTLPSVIDPTKDEDERALAMHAKVATFMTIDPVTASPMDPLEKVALTMRRNKIGGVPVVEEGELLGIITESDIFRAFIEILGSEVKGARIEITMADNQETLYEVMEVLREEDMYVQAISLYKDFSDKHQLLTLRIQGDGIEDAVEALWDSGFKVNSVIFDTME